MRPIIEVKNISKKYKYGQNTAGYLTLRDTISGWVNLPLRLLKNHSQSDLESGEFWALKNISFIVNPGEVIGIIGGNGAGKSTLLKIFSQITPPTQGEIILRGRVASLLEVGTGFNPELTGRENIYLNGAILGMTQSEIRSRFKEIVAFAEIGDFLDTVVKHYSSGMYMRLAFSVAAHLNSEILIVDEVLSVGDNQFQKKCLGKMDNVARSGRTVLFVSHNLDAVRQLCTRSILLDHGKMIKDGPTKSVISTYLAANLYTSDKQFFHSAKSIDGSVTLNRFHIEADKQTIKWQAEIDFHKTPSQFNFVIGITSQSGQRILALASEPSISISKLKHTGRYNLTGEYSPIILQEGTYQIDIGIRFNDMTVIYVPESGYLKIGMSTRFPGQNGLILTKSDWNANYDK